MIEAITWWLALELIGLAAFPLAFVFFRFLPDRGYSVSKVFGLLLMGYVIWITGMAGVLPNARWSLVLILVLIASASAAVVARCHRDVVSFFKDRWGVVLFAEALFSAAFVVAAFLRSYSPDISWNLGENQMDFAFINAILRSDHFPPKDPWLSGHSIPYYYFGHLVAASLIKLVAVPSRIGFNLALASVAALAASAAFGLVYNLVAAAGALRRALTFGLLAALFLLVLSNLVGLFYLLAAHNIGSEAFYGMVDLAGLDGPTGSSTWYPTNWWWINGAGTFDYGGADRSFPFWGFFMGGLHAEIMAIPFVLVAMAAALNLWRSSDPLNGRFWLAHPLPLALTALAIGVLGFTHPWDLPTYVFLLAMLALGRNYLSRGLSLGAVLDTTAFVVPVVVLVVVLFLPFYWTFHPGGGGIRLLEIATNTSWLPREAWLTQPHHLLYMWLPFLWLAGSLAVVALRGWRDQRSVIVAAVVAAVIAGLTPLLLWAALLGIRRGPTGFVEEIGDRNADWVTLLILLSLLALVALALGRKVVLLREGQSDQSAPFALAIAGTAVLLLMGPELFWVHDPLDARFNTVSKTGYQAWVLFSISGAFAIYYITSQWRAQNVRALLGRFGWGALTAIVLGAGLVYPVTATFWRTGDFKNDRTLDGLALVRRFERPEYDAILWLSDNVKGTPVLLEAVGGGYTPTGRVASRTGLPTVLVWADEIHEHLWRGSWAPQGGQADSGGWCPSVRCVDIERAYTTFDPADARDILQKYDVEYVYVGPLERQQYGEAGMSKFAIFMDVAYENEEVVIYRMPNEGPSVRAP